MKHIASVSFGKDSLAMLLRLVEHKQQLDEVVFYDTGMEFQAIYDTRDKVIPILKMHGIAYTELKSETPFLYDMLERPVKKRGTQTIHKYGYSWCGLGGCRWGTTAKLKALDAYCKDAMVYVGIAHDETERLNKERSKNKLFPLADWGMTEGECLLYCYKKGFTWMENGRPLYAIIDRVSCWCCGLKNLKELKNYKQYLPEYWEKLKELQRQTDRPMKGKGKSVFDLEKRFEQEEQNG